MSTGNSFYFFTVVRHGGKAQTAHACFGNKNPECVQRLEAENSLSPDEKKPNHHQCSVQRILGNIRENTG